MEELAGDDGRAGGAQLRQLPLPEGMAGRTYGELFASMTLTRKLLPLGLYRRKSENAAWRLYYVSALPPGPPWQAPDTVLHHSYAWYALLRAVIRTSQHFSRSSEVVVRIIHVKAELLVCRWSQILRLRKSWTMGTESLCSGREVDHGWQHCHQTIPEYRIVGDSTHNPFCLPFFPPPLSLFPLSPTQWWIFPRSWDFELETLSHAALSQELKAIQPVTANWFVTQSHDNLTTEFCPTSLVKYDLVCTRDYDLEINFEAWMRMWLLSSFISTQHRHDHQR